VHVGGGGNAGAVAEEVVHRLRQHWLQPGSPAARFGKSDNISWAPALAAGHDPMHAWHTGCCNLSCVLSVHSGKGCKLNFSPAA
jgi:hypothetical protein